MSICAGIGVVGDREYIKSPWKKDETLSNNDYNWSKCRILHIDVSNISQTCYGDISNPLYLLRYKDIPTAGAALFLESEYVLIKKRMQTHRH